MVNYLVYLIFNFQALFIWIKNCIKLNYNKYWYFIVFYTMSEKFEIQTLLKGIVIKELRFFCITVRTTHLGWNFQALIPRKNFFRTFSKILENFKCLEITKKNQNIMKIISCAGLIYFILIECYRFLQSSIFKLL